MCASFAAFATPAQAAELGTVPDITWGTTPAEIDRTVALMRDAGVRSVRANVGWSAVERDGRGVYNRGWLAQLDYALAAARRAGLEVLVPISDGVPYWASADPAKTVDGGGVPRWNVRYRPSNYADYADFVRFVVERYRGLGVRAYEIWNEPNHSWFWPSGVDAREYARMLAAAYPAVKAADPGAAVVLGGLAAADWSYLEALYAAGAAPNFDVVAVHPYTGAADPALCWAEAGATRNARHAFCGIAEVRATMLRHGDAAKEIWLTEFGWSASTARYGVTETQQRDYLENALAQLDRYPYVTKAFYYGFRNIFWLRDDPGNLQAGYGLLRADFTAKPAFEVFKRYATAPRPAPTVFAAAPVAEVTPVVQPKPQTVKTKRKPVRVPKRRAGR